MELILSKKVKKMILLWQEELTIMLVQQMVSLISMNDPRHSLLINLRSSHSILKSQSIKILSSLTLARVGSPSRMLGVLRCSVNRPKMRLGCRYSHYKWGFKWYQSLMYLPWNLRIRLLTATKSLVIFLSTIRESRSEWKNWRPYWVNQTKESTNGSIPGPVSTSILQNLVLWNLDPSL